MPAAKQISDDCSAYMVRIDCSNTRRLFPRRLLAERHERDEPPGAESSRKYRREVALHQHHKDHSYQQGLQTNIYQGPNIVKSDGSITGPIRNNTHQDLKCTLPSLTLNRAEPLGRHLRPPGEPMFERLTLNSVNSFIPRLNRSAVSMRRSGHSGSPSTSPTWTTISRCYDKESLWIHR